MRFEILTSVVAALLLASCGDEGSYAGQCPAPLEHWRKPADGIGHHAIVNRIRLAGGGGISWNGVAIDEATLIRLVEQTRGQKPLPFLVLSPDVDAECDRVRRLRALMDEHYCRLRWACGEGPDEWPPAADSRDATGAKRSASPSRRAGAA